MGTVPYREFEAAYSAMETLVHFLAAELIKQTDDPEKTFEVIQNRSLKELRTQLKGDIGIERKRHWTAAEGYLKRYCDGVSRLISRSS